MTITKDIAITSIETMDFFEPASKAYMFSLDEIQSATVAQTQDKENITGKQGRAINSLKRNKAITISGNSGIVSGGLLELQTGGKFVNKKTQVMWCDYLTVASNKATTSFKAVGAEGNEIESIYVRNGDGTLGKEYTQNSTADATGHFAYTPTTKQIDFFEGDIDDGTEIVVYYKRQIQADVLENMSDHYSGKATAYINAMGEDKCANIYRVQIYVPLGDFNGEFSLEMGENQAVHAFEFEALAGSGCGMNQSGLLWTWTIFGSDAEDAVDP